MERRVTGNCHARCGVGEKPEAPSAPEAHLSLFALPDGFTEIISTMRSRNISANIILQNKAQLQALFKDTYQAIIGNCDTLIYLGGNEPETHKYITEMLGKYTLGKRSSSESLGSKGSASSNFDVVGRELMTPDEVRRMDNKKELVFIRGCNCPWIWLLRMMRKETDGCPRLIGMIYWNWMKPPGQFRERSAYGEDYDIAAC